MPFVQIDGERFLLHYPQGFADKLLYVAQRYRGRRKRGQVDWEAARQDGELDFVPRSMTNKQIGKYVSTHLCYQNPVNRKKRIEYQRKSQKFNKDYWNRIKARRYRLFTDLRDTKKRLPPDYPTQNTWTDDQWNMLDLLTSMHRKTPTCIDWQAIMHDPLLKRLPNQNLATIRSYCWSRTTRTLPRVLKKRREEALRYKRKNSATYYRLHKKRSAKIRAIVNTFLADHLTKGDG